ncbi:MAG: hypothetical protein PVG07_12010 [Acidobacteriota bacterium]|jgi:hypothetical protein
MIGLNVALSAFSFAAKNIASGLLGEAGKAAMGGLLGKILGGSDLDEQEISELKQVNQTLLSIRGDLHVLDTDLKTIEGQLSQILGEEKLRTWLQAHNQIASGLAHIETDFQNYTEYTTPIKEGERQGQLPRIPPDDLDKLVDRIYKAPGDTDEDALTRIQHAIGGVAGHGLLDLLARLLVDALHQRPAEELTSEDLERACRALSDYFLRLLVFQLNAAILLVEGRNYSGDDPAVIREEWNQFQSQLDGQYHIFLKELWGLVAAWRLRLQGPLSSFGFSNGEQPLWSAPGATRFSDQDRLAFLPGLVHSTRQTGYPGGKGYPYVDEWYRSAGVSALESPEQTYFLRAEAIVAAFSQTSSRRRVVLHVLIYNPVVNTGTGVAHALETQAIPLEGSNSDPQIFVYKAPIYNSSVYLIRQVYDLTEDGTFCMKNVNASFPAWGGYGGSYQLQSDVDLGLEVTVDEKNPVGVIRFCPYTQQR